MDLVELVEVRASCVENFAGVHRFLHVCANLGERTVVARVGGALAKIIKRSNVSAPGVLQVAPAWLQGVPRDVDENVLGC